MCLICNYIFIKKFLTSHRKKVIKRTSCFFSHIIKARRWLTNNNIIRWQCLYSISSFALRIMASLSEALKCRLYFRVLVSWCYTYFFLQATFLGRQRSFVSQILLLHLHTKRLDYTHRVLAYRKGGNYFHGSLYTRITQLFRGAKHSVASRAKSSTHNLIFLPRRFQRWRTHS